MSSRHFLLGGLLVLLGVALSAQPRVVTLATGRLTATEAESMECYFVVGAHTTVVLRPDDSACAQLRALLNSSGSLFFVLD